jgi:hypothetical protein
MKKGTIVVNRLYLAGKCGAPGGRCKNKRCLFYGACQLIHNRQEIKISVNRPCIGCGREVEKDTSYIHVNICKECNKSVNRNNG